MFIVQPKSPNDGIASGPHGGPRSISSGDCERNVEWTCHPASSLLDDEVLSCEEHCDSIYTCEPADEPEYEGANDLMAAGGGTEEEPE